MGKNLKTVEKKPFSIHTIMDFLEKKKSYILCQDHCRNKNPLIGIVPFVVIVLQSSQ